MQQISTTHTNTHAHACHVQFNPTGTHWLVEQKACKKRKSARVSRRAHISVRERGQFCHAHWAYRSMLRDDSGSRFHCCGSEHNSGTPHLASCRLGNKCRSLSSWRQCDVNAVLGGIVRYCYAATNWLDWGGFRCEDQWTSERSCVMVAGVRVVLLSQNYHQFWYWGW